MEVSSFAMESLLQSASGKLVVFEFVSIMLVSKPAVEKLKMTPFLLVRVKVLPLVLTSVLYVVSPSAWR